MVKVILIEKSGDIKNVDFVPSTNFAEALSKKCKFKSSANFGEQATWTYKKDNIRLQLWARNDGRAGQENKYEFPPPVDNQLFFGSCIVLAYKYGGTTHVLTDLTAAKWRQVYDHLFGGFHNLADAEGDNDDVNEEDELDKIPKKRKTAAESGGYLKDGFVVDDDDDEEEEEEDASEDEDEDQDQDQDQDDSDDDDDANRCEDRGEDNDQDEVDEDDDDDENEDDDEDDEDEDEDDEDDDDEADNDGDDNSDVADDDDDENDGRTRNKRKNGKKDKNGKDFPVINSCAHKSGKGGENKEGKEGKTISKRCNRNGGKGHAAENEKKPSISDKKENRLSDVRRKTNNKDLAIVAPAIEMGELSEEAYTYPNA